MSETVQSDVTRNYRYKLNDKPPLLEGIVLGFQHVCVMMAGLLSVPITFASALNAAGMTIEASYIIQCSLFASGVTTIVQSLGIWKIGSRLPVSMGVSFVFVVPGIMVASKWGIASLMTSFIICGILEALFGAFLINKLKKIFPPLVSGAVVTCMGIVLAGTAVAYIGGGFGVTDFAALPYLGMALLTLVIIIVLNRFTKGFINAASVLIGIGICYAISAIMGKVDFAPVAAAPWFSIPIPLSYGVAFNWNSFGIVLVLYLASMMEFIGSTSATTEVAAGRGPTNEELRGGILCDGLGSSFSALFNSLPNVSYSNSVGLIAVTGVASRFVMAICGAILVVLGFFPKISAVLSIIPPAVLGGSMIVLFGMVTTAGIDILKNEKMTQRNMLILGVSLAIGISFGYNTSALVNLPSVVQILISGMPGTAITAMILNLVLPREKDTLKPHTE